MRLRKRASPSGSDVNAANAANNVNDGDKLVRTDRRQPFRPSDAGRFDHPPLSFTARLSGRRGDQPSSMPASDAPSLFTSSHTTTAQNKTQTQITRVQMQPQAQLNDGWSDSDDDEFNLTGEYTGKYKILRVPTKTDPPMSRSREWRESWGRPVSPFPYSEIMERSLPLSDFPEDEDDKMIILDDPSAWEVATEPPPSDEPSPSPSPSPSVDDEFGDLDNLGDLDEDFSLFDAGDVDAESTEIRPLVLPFQQAPDSDQTVLEEEEEEAQVDRELSVAIDEYPDAPATLPEVQAVVEGEADEDDSSDDDEVVEGEVIKITSGDAKAAARAAAILRMHDYDCFLAAEREKRAKPSRKRQRTIEDSGVSKPCIDSRSRRQTIEVNQVSPNSWSPLFELWKDADASFHPSPVKVGPRPEPQIPPPARRWNRDCWRCLGKCLTAERLAVSTAHGDDLDFLASTEDISKDSVLERFITQLGGESVIAGLGPDWSRQNLIVRLDVLIKKQSRYATRSSLVARQDSCSSLDSTMWTPSRTPELRAPHPKDRVHLRNTSLPSKSMLPVLVRPKRLVDLRHLSPSKFEREGPAKSSRPKRRSSGVSVRDLVRQFDGLDESVR